MYLIETTISELRRPLRPSREHHQREDLHLHVVLVHILGSRLGRLPALPDPDSLLKPSPKFVASLLRATAGRQGSDQQVCSWIFFCKSPYIFNVICSPD
jgi:hypothetical protein